MKTIKLSFFIAAITILFGATSCIDDLTIRGNGIEGNESRYAPSFDKVKSSGAFDVHITNGEEYEVVVNAETNLLQYIETDVSGNTLDIHIRGIHNVKNRLPMEVYITVPRLRAIKQSGSGVVTTGHFESDEFDISVSGSGLIETAVDCNRLDALISGSGKIFVSGVTNYSKFKISGSGQIDAYDLTAKDCETNISGSGNVYTYVERYLKASISGSGSVFYKGSPSVESHISGSGKIIQH